LRKLVLSESKDLSILDESWIASGTTLAHPLSWEVKEPSHD